MKSRFVVAQMAGEKDFKRNLNKAGEVLKRAKQELNGDFVLFPETFMCYVTGMTQMSERIALSQSLKGPFVKGMMEYAKEYSIWTAFGMRESAGEKNYNTTVMINSQGEIVRYYRKTHLYDAFGSMESKEFLSGEELFDPIDTPFGKLGMFVCYEARFPEIARIQALKGAEILLMPTAWVRGKRKREQLETLASARALENTCYLLASNLCGGFCTGGSMVIDPLGEILEEADQEEILLVTEIDTDRIKEIRDTVPSLKNRREELYK